MQRPARARKEAEAKAKAEAEARKQAEAEAARVREAVATVRSSRGGAEKLAGECMDLVRLEEKLLSKLASDLKESENRNQRQYMELKEEFTTMQKLTDQRIDQDLGGMQDAIAQVRAEEVLPLKAKVDELQIRTKKLEEEFLQLREELKRARVDDATSYQDRLRELDQGLTGKIQEVRESLATNVSKHDGQLASIQEQLNSLRKSQELAGERIEEDRSKLESCTKTLQEVGEDLKVLKEQFETRGVAQEQRATELQQDLAKLAKEIQKEQRELTKPMQDSLESIKRSQSELERKLAKHAEDVDCQMQEDFIAREESLTSLKY